MRNSKNFRRKVDQDDSTLDSRGRYSENQGEYFVVEKKRSEYEDTTIPPVYEYDAILSDINDIKKAVILSEILGKPRSMRNWSR
jgi:hypothetical protein